MHYFDFIRIIFVMVLTSLLVTSCQEKDDLYGKSPDEYTSGDDAKAVKYFSDKEAACVKDKEDFAAELADGWIEVGLLVEGNDGKISPSSESDLVFASLRFNYENVNGGIMQLTLVNRLGYSKSLRLHPCNAQDSYFYIANQSPPNKLENILAFSITNADRPGATDLGRELGLMDSRHRIVGLTIMSNQSGEPQLRTKLGDVGYLSYLIRKKGAREIPDPAGTFDAREYTGTCSNTPRNGITVVGREIASFTLGGITTAHRGYSTNVPYVILRDSRPRDTGGKSVAIFQRDPGLGSVEDLLPITVYDGRRKVMSFSAWVGTGLTSQYGATNGSLTIRL